MCYDILGSPHLHSLDETEAGGEDKPVEKGTNPHGHCTQVRRIAHSSHYIQKKKRLVKIIILRSYDFELDGFVDAFLDAKGPRSLGECLWKVTNSDEATDCRLVTYPLLIPAISSLRQILCTYHSVFASACFPLCGYAFAKVFCLSSVCVSHVSCITLPFTKQKK